MRATSRNASSGRTWWFCTGSYGIVVCGGVINDAADPLRVPTQPTHGPQLPNDFLQAHFTVLQLLNTGSPGSARQFSLHRERASGFGFPTIVRQQHALIVICVDAFVPVLCRLVLCLNFGVAVSRPATDRTVLVCFIGSVSVVPLTVLCTQQHVSR